MMEVVCLKLGGGWDVVYEGGLLTFLGSMNSILTGYLPHGGLKATVTCNRVSWLLQKNTSGRRGSPSCKASQKSRVRPKSDIACFTCKFDSVIHEVHNAKSECTCS